MLKLEPKTFLGLRQRRWSSTELCIDLSHYSAGCALPRHGHTNAFFCFVLTGACEEDGQGSREMLRPGSLVYHPAGFEHSDCWHEEGRCLHVEFTPGFHEGIASTRLRKPVVQTHGGRAGDAARRIYDELLHPDSASGIAFEGLVLQLLAETIRDVDHESRIPRWLRRVRDQLHEESVSVPSLKQIASEAGVHPSYLAASFQQQFGVSIGEFVRSRRIVYAREILTNSDQSLSEVAHLLGFSDQSHFCRTFKKQTGLSPLEYRRLFARRSLSIQ